MKFHDFILSGSKIMAPVMFLGKEIVGAKFWVKHTCLFTVVAGHFFAVVLMKIIMC